MPEREQPRVPLTYEFKEWLKTQNLYLLGRSMHLPHESQLYRLQQGWNSSQGSWYPIKTLPLTLAERILSASGTDKMIHDFWPEA